MKIIIFGATGDVGRKVVTEAVTRAHQVSAIGRSEAKLACLPEGITTIQADLDGDTELLRNVISGHDLIISALRPDEGLETALVALTRKVLSLASGAGIPIIVTGGAALLKLADDSGDTVLSAPGFLPDAVRPIAEACAAQNALLERESAADWICLRPPPMLLDNDRRSQYRFGTDTLVIDDAGLSQISYTDFAAAMLDVAEKRDEFAQLITVAWSTPPA